MVNLEILKTLCSLDGKERVQILRRDGDRFGYSNEYLSQSGSGPSWVGLGLPFFISYDSAEAAERAARINVLWLLSEARKREEQADGPGPAPASPDAAARG
jgi:hypothetical protein